MSDGLKIQGEVSLSTGNAEEALNRVGNKADQMAINMSEAGAKAGKAIDQIGEIAKAQSEKFTRSESVVVASIKRLTAEAAKAKDVTDQLGNIEFNIAAKGLDPARFQPMLEVVRKVSSEAQTAATSINTATTPALNKLGISAAQTAAAMRQVPAQFTDIITSLQAGQAPMTVLLQQGGQLKDAFGGIGPAAQALGGYVAGLINPFTVAAVAAGGLAIAYNEGSKEATAYAKALILSGNAVGVTAGQLQMMARGIDAVAGTQRNAAAALLEFAGSAAVGSENLLQFATVAVKFERATGTAISTTVKQFEELKKAPLEASLKLNESMNYLTVSIYQQIKALMEQGRVTEAADLAQKTFAENLDKSTTGIEKNLGTIEKGWIAIKDAIGSVANAALDIGRVAGPEAQLSSAQSNLAALEQKAQDLRERGRSTSGIDSRVDAARQLVLSLQAQVDLNQQNAKQEGDRAAQVKARAQADKDSLKYLSDQQKMVRQIAAETETLKAAGASREEIEKRIAAIRKSYEKKGGSAGSPNRELEEEAKLLARLSGVNADYMEQLTRLQGIRAKGRLTEQEYVEAVKELIGLQPAAKKAAEEQAKYIKDIEKAAAGAQAEVEKVMRSYNATVARSIENAQREAEANEQLAATYGLTKGQIEAVELARLEEQLAQRASLGLTLDEIQNLEKLIDAKRRSAAALSRVDAMDAAKKLSENWKRDFDRIEDWIGAAIGRGVTKGKDIFKSLIDGLKASFARLVLSPIISPIAAFGASMLNPGAAQAAGSVAGSLGSAGSFLSIGKTIYEGFSTGFAGLSGQISGYVQSGINAVTGSGGFIGQGPMQIGQFAQGVGTTAGFAAGGAVGIYGGRALSNGYAISGSGNGAVNAGTVIGAFLGGPIGAAIGGLIGGAANRLFGRKLRDSGIEGSVSGGDFSGRSFEFYKGGLFRSDKTTYSDLDAKGAAPFQDAISLLYDSFGDLGKAVGVGKDALSDFTTSFRVSLKGLSDADADKAIAKAIAGVSDSMAVSFVNKFRGIVESFEEQIEYIYTGISNENGEQYLTPVSTQVRKTVEQERLSSPLDPYIDDMVRIFDTFRESVKGVEGSEGQLTKFTQDLFGLGDAFVKNQGFIKGFGEALDFDKLEAAGKGAETVLDTFNRLNTVFGATNAVAAALGANVETAFGAIGLASTEARERLIKLAGGIDALSAGTAFFTQNFLSEAERIAPITASVQQALESLGQGSVDTKEEFKALVTGLDLSTEAGAKMYAQLINLAPAFLTVVDYADSLAAKTKELAIASKNLDIELMEINGDTTGAMAARRAEALANADPTLRDKMTRNWAAQDAAAAAADFVSRQQAAWEAAMAEGNNRDSLRIQLMQLEGNDDGALALQREMELGGISASLRPLQELIYAREDEIKSIENAKIAVSGAFDVLQRAVEAERRTITGAYNDVMTSFSQQINSVNGSISKLTGLSSTLRSAVNGMRLESNLGADRLGAQSQISTALLMARAGGVFPESESIKDALSIVAQPSEGLFSSFVEFQRDSLLTSNNINELANLADGQLSIEQQSLQALEDQKRFAEQAYKGEIERLDGILTNAQLQIDALNGINVSVLSVTDAISGLNGAISGALAAISAAGDPVPKIPGFASGGYHSGGLRLVGEYGPELEVTGPSRIFNSSDTASIFRQSDNTEVAAEVRALRDENAQLRQELGAAMRSVAESTRKTAELIDRVSNGGGAFLVEMDT